MKSQECPQEPDILRAGRNSLEDDLRQLARETRPPHRLPEAGELWWRAEIIRRWVERDDAVREAERPLFWSRAVAFALVLLTSASLFAAAPPLVALLVAGALAPLTFFLGWLVLQRDA